ncbi:MAG TPA: hypothetical protein VGL20_16430 [Candidatus Dormibacteraeota bacterium]|jgi:hypothetical protein
MSELSPQLRQAFAELAAESDVAPPAAFQARARAAMHAAVSRRAARSPLRRLPGRRAAALGAALATASAAVLLVAGWSAPAGSLLHPVRLARERVTLALPGGDRAARELGFAEDRLHEAAGASNPAAALSEASSLLAAAGHDLDGGDGAQRGRWSRDETRLRQARGSGSPGRSGTGATEDSGGGPRGGEGSGGGSGANPLPAGAESGGGGRPGGSASPTAQAMPRVGGSGSGSGRGGGGPQPTAPTGASPSGGDDGSGRVGSGGGGDASSGRGGGRRSSAPTPSSSSSGGHG